MASSQGGRSYSDPSYGSVKALSFETVTAGTRATGLVDTVKVMNPITVLDWNMSNMTLGTGGSSQWVIAATSDNGTSALGTIIFVGTHAAGVTVDGSVSGAGTSVAAGGRIDFYSVLSTAAGLTVKPTITYRETFVVGDN